MPCVRCDRCPRAFPESRRASGPLWCTSCERNRLFWWRVPGLPRFPEHTHVNKNKPNLSIVFALSHVLIPLVPSGPVRACQVCSLAPNISGDLHTSLLRFFVSRLRIYATCPIFSACWPASVLFLFRDLLFSLAHPAPSAASCVQTNVCAVQTAKFSCLYR